MSIEGPFGVPMVNLEDRNYTVSVCIVYGVYGRWKLLLTGNIFVMVHNVMCMNLTVSCMDHHIIDKVHFYLP